MASVPGLLAGLAPLLQAGRAQAAEAPGVEVLSDEAGFGTHPAQKGDLLLLHYTGLLQGQQVACMQCAGDGTCINALRRPTTNVQARSRTLASCLTARWVAW